MGKTHVVEQGEHIVRIAVRHGFRRHETVWDHPLNAELKQLRQNPNVLFPGDVVAIPDLEPRIEEKPTGAVHPFVTPRINLRLRVVAEDLYERPLSDTECDLHLGAKVIPLTTDANGMIDTLIPHDAAKAKLVFHQADSVLDEVEVPLYIGSLDPVEEPTGQKARLNNLGYFAGTLDDTSGDDRMLRSAIEEFQCDHGLAVDGVCGPVTQAKLKEAHGC